jgi:hypothetical protein
MDILKKERRLLALLGQALTLAEAGQMPIREVEKRRRALTEFYGEVFGTSMLAKREKLRSEVLGR